eukprot:CAMPEP_0202449032 /NCGR_PEP_ID=MMETSP1360-20130828/7813_1 /ASSEMBLY_ACC=CAM_ASM_000848 /TAXON_ID=515479 /ORGANISM="Licmophora paradoxa, Strain CCMP2313" /LENGTH=308 /DNA_ID=CAMNT_0049066839 /DNA_START=312 /DNA_END=1238 /DNA_ORIENTATION=+
MGKGKGKGSRSKGSKSEASRVEPAPYLLQAEIGRYPGYEGEYYPLGIVRGRFNTASDEDSTSMLFKLNIGGLERLCLGCGVHIHVGTTCESADEVGGHYWNTIIFGESDDEDPWNAESYQTDYLGRSTSGFVIDSGFGIKDNTGRAVVIHGQDGTRIGCGILEPAPENTVGSLYSDIVPYPGAELTTLPIGEVEVEFFSDSTLLFRYNVEGLEANCMDCGVHIHTGITCDDEDLVLGHYWDLSEKADDPWVVAEGASYNTDSEGKASGHFFLFSGYGFEETVGRALVFHGQDGGRLGCGMLLPPLGVM